MRSAPTGSRFVIVRRAVASALMGACLAVLAVPPASAQVSPPSSDLPTAVEGVVVDRDTGSTPLPRTGSDPLPEVLAAVGLAGVGTVLVVAARRRPTRS